MRLEGSRLQISGSNNADDDSMMITGGSTHTVKTKKPNGYGLYDIIGNVWEWTLDEWHDNYSDAPSQAEKPWGSIGECKQSCGTGSSSRVYRGGCWGDNVRHLRVADRSTYMSGDRDSGLGFRVRRTLP